MNIQGISNPQAQNLEALVDPVAVQATASKNKEGAPLLGDASVRIVTPADINQLVDLLKAETDDNRRDLTRSRLANALTVILNGSLLDGKDKEIVEEIDEKTEEYNDLKETDWDKVIADLQGKLGGLQDELTALQIKTKEIEAAIERIKKTPEEQRTEQQKKELAELEAQKAQVASDIKDTTAQKEQVEADLAKAQESLKKMNDLGAEINDLFNQLSSGVRTALAEAAKLGPEDDEVLKGVLKDKPKDPNVKDAETQLADLLGGAKLAEVIAGKRPIKA